MLPLRVIRRQLARTEVLAAAARRSRWWDRRLPSDRSRWLLATKSFSTNSDTTRPPITPAPDNMKDMTMHSLPEATSNTIYMALAGNTLITALKFAVWLRTGSSAMLAETVHTFADALNQGLLVLGLRQSMIAPDKRHP